MIPAFIVGLGYLFLMIVFVCFWWIILKKNPIIARTYIGDDGARLLPMTILIIMTAGMLLADISLAVKIPPLIIFALLAFMCAVWLRAYVIK